MIKQRQVFQDLIVEYSGTPSISVTVDGSSKLSNLALPTHSNRQTRIVSLPQGVIGYVPQLTTSHTDIFRYQFRGVPEGQYSQQNIYHFWQITFQGTVDIGLFMDETVKNPNDGGSTTITLSPRESRSQDTRRVYYPPLSYGYVPHLRHFVSSTNSGQILNAVPQPLPPKYYRGLREHSEIRVTHEGLVRFNVYLDGEKLADYQFDESSSNDFVTQKEYLPAGSSGQVLQWIQDTGDGEIAIFESDITLLDKEEPNSVITE